MYLEQQKQEIETCLNIYEILDEFQTVTPFPEFRQRCNLLNGPTDIINTIANVLDKA